MKRGPITVEGQTFDEGESVVQISGDDRVLKVRLQIGFKVVVAYPCKMLERFYEEELRPATEAEIKEGRRLE